MVFGQIARKSLRSNVSVITQALQKRYKSQKSTLLQDGIGLYFYDKTMPSSSPVPCCVAVHAVEVSYLTYSFPEMGLRRQEWFSPQAAAAAVDEPELKVLLESFVPSQIRAQPGKEG